MVCPRSRSERPGIRGKHQGQTYCYNERKVDSFFSGKTDRLPTNVLAGLGALWEDGIAGISFLVELSDGTRAGGYSYDASFIASLMTGSNKMLGSRKIEFLAIGAHSPGGFLYGKRRAHLNIADKVAIDSLIFSGYTDRIYAFREDWTAVDQNLSGHKWKGGATHVLESNFNHKSFSDDATIILNFCNQGGGNFDSFYSYVLPGARVYATSGEVYGDPHNPKVEYVFSENSEKLKIYKIKPSHDYMLQHSGRATQVDLSTLPPPR